jgi:hypothetical protein
MNAMGHSPESTWPDQASPTNARDDDRIDLAALAAAAADRRARLRNIETLIETACEAAVRRRRSPGRRADNRESWDHNAWSVYVQEALYQNRLYLRSVAALRREAEHLEHLVKCFSRVAR